MNYDTIVIGAGSAGSIIASRLSEDPARSVLLLEAGPDYATLDNLPYEIKFGYGQDRNIWAKAFGVGAKHNWEFIARSTDQAGPMMVPRGKIVGGSSAVNAQVFLRGLPEDYDSWAAMGNDKWGFRELLPYFKKNETDPDFHDDFHGNDGPIILQRFAEPDWNPEASAFYYACLEMGYPISPDLNSPNSTGVGRVPLNNPGGIRMSTAIGYLEPTRHRLNLTIKGDCLVHRVIFDGMRAKGVLVESQGELFNVLGDEIILCAGPIGSPQILMLSGVGSFETLNETGVPIHVDLPGVGQNLRDHPQVPVTFRTSDSYKQTGMEPRIQIALQYTSNGSNLRNDMIIFCQGFALEEGYYVPTDSEPLGIYMVPAIYLAKGSGHISLTSKDPHVQPYLDYNFLQEEFDRDRLREGVRTCLRIGNSHQFNQIIQGCMDPTPCDLESDSALDSWMMRKVATSHHISGTCKMAPSNDPMGVVDQYGKVYGTEGLIVADASIMPDCIRANTNITAMVIGERIANMIQQGF
jgi:choline dehydrogenase